MNETSFKNLRFDPDVTPFHDLAKSMAKAFGYTANLSIDQKLAQLVRLRVAQKNCCSYCTILHAKTAREIGIAEAKVDHIAAWWNSELYTEIEKNVLAYTDELTEGNTKDFDQYHKSLQPYFNEVEIAELAAIIINMNLWTRLKLAQGQVPYSTEASK